MRNHVHFFNIIVLKTKSTAGKLVGSGGTRGRYLEHLFSTSLLRVMSSIKFRMVSDLQIIAITREGKLGGGYGGFLTTDGHRLFPIVKAEKTSHWPSHRDSVRTWWRWRVATRTNEPRQDLEYLPVPASQLPEGQQFFQAHNDPS